VAKGRVGILGGTFDPIHVGHLIAAEGVRTELRLDRVIFIPAARPPHKGDASISDATHRLEMVRLAVDGNPAFEVSEMELDRGGTSYTIETVRELRAQYGPEVEIFLLMGADSLLELTTWKDYRSLLRECTVVVFRRPGLDLARVDPDIRERVRVVPTHEVGLASKDIRRRVREGKSIRYLVPPRVEAYVLSQNLYG